MKRELHSEYIDKTYPMFNSQFFGSRYNMDELDKAWADYRKEHSFEKWLKEQDLLQDE